MKKKSKKKTSKRTVNSGFLDVSFGIARDAHPQIYDFFLEHITSVLTQLNQPKSQLILTRLEPLNMVYSHLSVSNQIMHQIFMRYCKTHGLTPFASFSPKQKFSCKGPVLTRGLSQVLEDYNLLFDLFFCDVQLQTKDFFIDAMDLFSNRLLVHGNQQKLVRFQKAIRHALPKTRFRFV